MSLIIDSHIHLMPDSALELMLKLAPSPIKNIFKSNKLVFFRRQKQFGRFLFKPIFNKLHELGTNVRNAPDNVIKYMDNASGYLAVFGLLLEANRADLEDIMKRNMVDYALVLSHPPGSSNEFVFEQFNINPKLLPVINLPPNTLNPQNKLKRYIEAGAVATKIHAASDGCGTDFPLYHSVIKTATKMDIPVIIHTGCIHIKMFYKDPEMGHADRYKCWFEQYPNTKFILAHMNFHYPEIAIRLAEQYKNVYLETSWQPGSIICRAVNRVGENKVLLGSDWPLLSANIPVSIKRIEDCVKNGTLSRYQADRILGENAKDIFKIKI